MADASVRIDRYRFDDMVGDGGGATETLRGKLTEKLTGVPGFVPIAETEVAGVELVASTDLQTRYGDFRIFGFLDHGNGKEHTAIVQGDVRGKADVPVRVHSQCHTGDVWGSLRCDCRDQLEAAIQYIAERDYGAVIYLKQEGRGIGLLNKLKAYRLQDLGLDTVEANQYLGFPAEARDYGIAKDIIGLLELDSIALLSNNPDKIAKLEAEGVLITRRIPIVVESNKYNRHYLDTKRDRMGHLI